MQMTFEGSLDEVCKVFGVASAQDLMKNPGFSITLGKSEFTVNIRFIEEKFNYLGHTYILSLDGFDKKEEDIRKAKALVNYTKEAHKEAQRKLSELMEGKV